MKTHHCIPITLALLALNASAQEQPVQTSTPAAAASSVRQDSGLRFNFRNAPLEQVLNYLSDAAGFIIVLDTQVRGNVDMWSSQPVSKEEAVQLLNIALNKNGYSAKLQGRNLVISSKEDAKKRSLPVHTGNDPREIPETAEMVIQIIPLRYIDATQAKSDLSSLLPSSSTITANSDSNSLVVTDTQMNIHHIVEVVSALDMSMSNDSVSRVFRLKNADPSEMATLITNLFSSSTSSSSNNQNRNANTGMNPMMGGPGAFFSMMGNQGGRRNSSSSSSTSSRRMSPVSAIADPRTYTVIVSAGKDTMPQIAEIVTQLDSSPSRKQKVFVYNMENANVKQVETALKNLFTSSNTRSSSSSSTQTDILATRASNNTQTSSSSSTSSSGSSGSSSSR